MKPKINYYLIKVAKENSPYLISLLILIIVVLTSISLFTNKFNSLNNKINQTTKEVNDLKKKAEFVGYKEEIIKEGIDLNQVNKIFTKLIPNQEDFFSVIYALEEISKKTNFLIISYSVNLKATTSNKLAIAIEGKGDDQSFLNFLKDYRYVGGRLVTIDKIDYKTKGFAQLKLDINFYSGKGSTLQNIVPIKLTIADKKLIKEIFAKVKIDIKNDEETGSYPKKTNPF